MVVVGGGRGGTDPVRTSVRTSTAARLHPTSTSHHVALRGGGTVAMIMAAVLHVTYWPVGVLGRQKIILEERATSK